jgi:chromosome segregation ATPase
MRFGQVTEIQKVNGRVEMHYLRQILTVLIVLALVFVAVGLAVFVTRAQNPSCVDIKKRVDDAARQYQTVLTQSQSVDRNYASYQSAVGKLQDDLAANNKRRVQTERDIFEAQSDRARCSRNPDVLADGACANVTHRTDTAEKRLSYYRANQVKIETELSENQQRLATTKATLKAANANLSTAQQDLDEANRASAAAGCTNENARNR